MNRRFAFAIFLYALASIRLASAQLQTPETGNAIRVTVTLNEDGSRTTYQFDPSNHTAVATTTTADGKSIGKTEYVIDDEGHFASGVIYGARGEFRFKSRYKYEAGRLSEELQLSRDNVVQHKIVYSYDASGKQTGYAIFDGRGKLLGRTTSIKPSAR